MDDIQRKIRAALQRSKADYTEIRIEENESTRIVFRGRELETASGTIDQGGVVRCLVKDRGWGTVTFNNLEDLERKVDQAYECALVARNEEPIELAPVQPATEAIRADLQIDFRDISLAQKKALIEGYNQVMLGYSEKIVDTQAVYMDSFTHTVFANSEGAYLSEDRPSVGMMAIAIARQGDNVQTGVESLAGPSGFEFVQNKDAKAREAARRAVELLEAKPVQGGVYTVVCDQTLAGVFIHEAFGHLSESDFVYENPKAKEMMVLGRRFGKEILNVYDDGAIPDLRGSHRYDDEGVPTRRNYLIKEGILVGRMHSRETAAKMGEQPTGNARAINYRHAPIVRMTNTAIEEGETTFEEMIADVKLGIYACKAYGGQTALENFSFSSGYAYMIRDGKLAEMVKDVILAGNLFETLENIDAIGDDFEWMYGAGGCGKGAQYPLPVGIGAPHIRIQNVVIGGE